MSLPADLHKVVVLAQPLLASISEITASIVSIKIEQDSFIEIGCYFERITPAIMELSASENTPPNAIQILQSLTQSVNLAKFLLSKCHSDVQSIPNAEQVQSVIEQLVSVIRNIGESLSSIPSSAFTEEEEYAEVAIRSLSNEMQNFHLETADQVSVKESKQHVLENIEPEETDLYSINVQVSLENPQSFNMLQYVGFMKEMTYLEPEGQSSSSSKLIKELPQVAEYMEPIYKTFCCPLTKRIMDEPVTLESGVTYEKNAIAEWFKKFEDNPDEAFCPLTGNKVTINRALSINVALKGTIEMWKERNEASRIKVARAALSLASSENMVLEALRDLQNICQRKQYNNTLVCNSGMVSLLAQFLDHKDLQLRCLTLETLRLLVKDNDDGKDMIAKTKAISSTIKMLSSNHLQEKHASLTLLLELSTSQLLCEKIGSCTGLILMLIMMKYKGSSDHFSAEKADNILKNLERSPKNIKSMAENGYLEPLLNHLIEGSEKTQLEMASYLGEIVLGHDTRSFVAEIASPTLIEMVKVGDTLTRKTALKALVQISSHHPNGKILIDADILPILIEDMFTQRIYISGSKDSKEASAAILANILDSGIDFENLKVNSHGHAMASGYVVCNLIHMLKNSGSDELSLNLMKIILCLSKSQKSKASIVSVVKETEAIYALIELINSRFEELGIAAIKLLITLIPYIGHTIADRLCKTRDQPENLINSPTEIYRISEKQAIAANFLAKLPQQNLTLNLALLHKGTVPTILQTIHEIQKRGTRASRHANSYLEGLVGILVRFTSTLYEPEMLFLARNYNLTTVFTELLMKTSSDEIQRLSATGLENLSSESINLSKPPKIPRTKFMKLFYLPRSLTLSSSKKNRIQVCQIHKGACSSQSTFCLLDARAVERLLACLDSGNTEVVDAALSAISTLLDDKVDVDRSISILNEANAIQNVLNVLREHRQESVLQKSFWVIEKFLIKGGDSSKSDISQDRLLPSLLVTAFHHGEGNTRQMAEKILKHLDKMPNITTKF